MIIEVKVKAGAKENLVKKVSEKSYEVSVKAERKDGKANEALLRILSREMGYPLNVLKLKKGSRGKRKLIEILT